MKITFFSSKPYDEVFFKEANEQYGFEFSFYEGRFNKETAVFTKGSEAICLFVNDNANVEALEAAHEAGVKLVALRSAGFNHVDLEAASRLGMPVVRVPAYSPHAVAEHTLALALGLNRKTHRAYNRVKEGNFSLNGLIGFDLYKKTVGLIGLGKIGTETARIFLGFGCEVYGYDVMENKEAQEIGIKQVGLDEIFEKADLISLHCPLTPDTHHLINEGTIGKMKNGVMLINTSRGALIDTQAVINGLKKEKIGYLGLDVYEEEGDLFFEDLSNKVIQDDVFSRLLTFPNVLITGHQAFFTREAMENITHTTLQNIRDFEEGQTLKNEVKPEKVKG